MTRFLNTAFSFTIVPVPLSHFVFNFHLMFDLKTLTVNVH